LSLSDGLIDSLNAKIKAGNAIGRLPPGKLQDQRTENSCDEAPPGE
jgi:hypothetical protein